MSCYVLFYISGPLVRTMKQLGNDTFQSEWRRQPISLLHLLENYNGVTIRLFSSSTATSTHQSICSASWRAATPSLPSGLHLAMSLTSTIFFRPQSSPFQDPAVRFHKQVSNFLNASYFYRAHPPSTIFSTFPVFWEGTNKDQCWKMIDGSQSGKGSHASTGWEHFTRPLSSTDLVSSPLHTIHICRKNMRNFSGQKFIILTWYNKFIAHF